MIFFSLQSQVTEPLQIAEPMEVGASTYSQMTGAPSHSSIPSDPHTLSQQGDQLTGTPHAMQNVSAGLQRAGAKTVPVQMHQANQGQSRAENIKEILTSGRVTAADLQQIELIGSGNGGHVYK